MCMACNVTFALHEVAVMVAAVDSVEVLADAGIKPLPARALFKHIIQWKTDGLPCDFIPVEVCNANIVDREQYLPSIPRRCRISRIGTMPSEKQGVLMLQLPRCCCRLPMQGAT